MAITLIIGKPGDGKSYSAVEYSILPALKQGRSVYTNLSLNLDLLRYDLKLRPDHYLKDIPKDEINIQELSKIPGGTLIVLDEVWRYWKAQERNPSELDEKFFAEHRHKVGRMPGIDGLLSQDIVLITQNITDVPLWIRGRVATTLVCEKLSAAGFENKYRVDRYKGCNSRFPKDTYINASFSEYSSDVWRYYQSHTSSTEVGGVDAATLEKGAIQNVSVWRSSRMLGYYALLGAVIIFLGWTASNSHGAIFGNPDNDKPDTPQLTQIPIKPPVSNIPDPLAFTPSLPAPLINPPPIPNPQPTIQPSTEFWITGIIQYENKTNILLTNGSITKSYKTQENPCTESIETICIIDKISYSTNPLKRKSYLPESINQIAGMAQPARNEPAGAMPQ